MTDPPVSQPTRLLILSMGAINAKTFLEGCIGIINELAEEDPIPEYWKTQMENEANSLDQMMHNMTKATQKLKTMEPQQ